MIAPSSHPEEKVEDAPWSAIAAYTFPDHLNRIGVAMHE